MATITLNRGEKTQIPFSITDANNGLLGLRVTWAVAKVAGYARTLVKAGGLPGTTAEITISTQTAGAITGFINITAADYASMPEDSYVSTLWVDDGSGADRCVTAGGTDIVTINKDMARTA